MSPSRIPRPAFQAPLPLRIRPPHPRSIALPPRRPAIQTPHRPPTSSAQTPSPTARPEPPTSRPAHPSTPSLTRIATGLWQFSRPHTIYGTILSIASLTSVAILSALPTPLPLPLLSNFLTALIPSLLINLYIVGLNQLYDISIDRINKPYLPLAAGIMTPSDARLVITLSLIAGLAFCFAPAATPALRLVLIASTILGTAYSMPPFRLKRFPLLASMAILSVRGLLINLSFFRHALPISTASSTAVSLVACNTAFFVLFGIVIALLKDVPDIRGDRKFGIRTFSVRMGARAVFRVCVRVLCFMFLMAGFYHAVLARSVVGVVGAVLRVAIAGGLWWEARRVDVERSESIMEYYMLSWKAFYLEYLLLPLTLL